MCVCVCVCVCVCSLQMPSFRPQRNSDGTCTVHYFSQRDNLGPFTGAFLKAAARELYGLDIRVEHAIRKGINRADHDEFVLHMGPEYVWPCTRVSLSLCCRGGHPCPREDGVARECGVRHGCACMRLCGAVLPWGASGVPLGAPLALSDPRSLACTHAYVHTHSHTH